LYKTFEKLNNIKKYISRLFFCADGKLKNTGLYYLLIFSVCITYSLTGCGKRPPADQTPQMDTSPDFFIRVLLLKDITEAVITSSTNLNITSDTGEGKKYNSKLNITIFNSQLKINNDIFTGKKFEVKTSSPNIFSINDQSYRGYLKLIIDPEKNTFSAINIVPLEPYLTGVIGAEMPDYWEPQALKAQTIAARTYCLYIKKRFGTGRDYDMRKSQANQVYKGIDAESEQVWNAVNETKGMVLTCRQTDGTENIFPTYYSSTCGGHTEDSKNVFGDDFPALKGVPCQYCKNVAKPKYYFWPSVKFDHKTVTERLRNRYSSLEKLEDIVDIAIKKQTVYTNFTRVTAVELIGVNGKTDWLRAEDFRLAIDPSGRKIKSTIFKLTKEDDGWLFQSGRGFGHAVGMCQCGAQAMARQGADFKRILEYYYPGSKIIDVYNNN